jgi:hypothetical protein
LFSTTDRLERARVHELAAEQSVAAIASAYIRVHAAWREAELAATQAALLGRGQLKRKIVDVHKAQLEELAAQAVAADASLVLARRARERAERGQRGAA